jgi:hypothetical protein
MTPFLFILIMTFKKKNFLYISSWLAFPFYLLFTLNWWNVNNIALAAPISKTLAYLNPGVLLPAFPYTVWANIGRTIISAFCFYWIFYTFSQIKHES